MRFHLVSGDAIADAVAQIGGEVIVCRECLADGPVAENDFWKRRADFISDEFGATDYAERVKREFERLGELGDGDELNLWFGNDVFCQVNMWFSLTMIAPVPPRIFRVFPKSIDFGNESTDEMRDAFESRIELAADDVILAREMWRAFRDRDGDRLRKLGASGSNSFRMLSECCEAAAAIETRPARMVAQLRSEFGDDFNAVFAEFRRRDAIYGFGDSQVKRIFDA